MSSVVKGTGLLLAITSLGCEEPVSQPSTGGSNSRRQAPQNETKPVEVPRPKSEIKENDFVEAEGNRDPFRNYAKVFVDEARGQVKSQREIVLEQYAVDDLTLIGLITGTKPERAMLVDPTGLGHVVVRGQYIGRASVVQPAGGVGAGYEVTWRVDRIRENDLILVRDDPTNPEVPSSTRVIPLHTEDEVQTPDTSTSTNSVDNQLQDLKAKIRDLEAAERAKQTLPKR
jgi:type IV pilus assembly protein PilP